MRLPGQDVGRHVRTGPETGADGDSPDQAGGNEHQFPPQRRPQQKEWLLRAGTPRQRSGPGQPRPACVAGLAAYRAAVSELLFELGAQLRPEDPDKAEAILTERLDSPEFTPMLAATPGGAAAAIGELLADIRNHQPGVRSPGAYAAELTTMIRVYLLARVDVMWWGKTRPYLTDGELAASDELSDLEALRQRGLLRFQYRQQARTLLARAARAADRRIRPERVPRTAGLRSAWVRPEMVALLNQLADAFAGAAPPGTPTLWVTSLARSVEHQRQLRALGYKATLPSSHCVGYATDVEMAWFRQFGAHRVLARLLLERQEAGEVNVIDEGQVWHVCLSPAATSRLRPGSDAHVGG